MTMQHRRHDNVEDDGDDDCDDDGFFLACDDFGRMFDNLFPSPPALFFFFEVEISSRTLIPLIMPGSVHGGSAS